MSWLYECYMWAAEKLVLTGRSVERWVLGSLYTTVGVGEFVAIDDVVVCLLRASCGHCSGWKESLSNRFEFGGWCGYFPLRAGDVPIDG